MNECVYIRLEVYKQRNKRQTNRTIISVIISDHFFGEMPILKMTSYAYKKNYVQWRRQDLLR